MADRALELGWARILHEVGRTGNLTLAAERLGLSQPAVSYQIRKLEEQLHVPLLRRQHRGVELTAEGRRLFEVAARFVEEADELARDFRKRPQRRAIRIATDYAFSAFWLMPRMHAFRQRHPDMDIRIVASHRTGPAVPEEGEVSIVFGTQAEFSRTGILLLPEQVVPVCAPGFIARTGPLDVPERLASSTLLHLETEHLSPWHDWSSYLQAFGLRRERRADRGEVGFNTYSLVLQAAMAEQGVALGWLGLIDPLLESGMVVRCGPMIREPERGYWFVPPAEPGPETEALRLWLLEEFQQVLSSALLAITQP